MPDYSYSVYSDSGNSRVSPCVLRVIFFVSFVVKKIFSRKGIKQESKEIKVQTGKSRKH
jgi:hypothetical protein